MGEYVVDTMRPENWEQVRAIYLEGIATGDATFEENAPEWQEWDAAHLPEPRLVVRSGERVAAWAALSTVSRREVYLGVAEGTLYVAADFRGKGVGRVLGEALIAASEAAGIWTLQGMVFLENKASLALLKSAGFRVVGTRERIGKHRDTWRDVLLLERRSPVVGVD